ncbi:MAG: 4Fe-4S dicluster domain-containing protein [Acidobacteriota bacterium]|nr:4Fe-4S dicluster domain-containing protein [Acidobacteriota bacterium]
MGTVPSRFVFRDAVIAETPGGSRLVDCIQCGTCGGSCPNGSDMDHTPRALFAMINAGMRDDVLSSNTPWMCVSCYMCTSRCPQEVPITDLMYTLKNMSVRNGRPGSREAPALARTFARLVERYGRSYEFGLASRYYLGSKPGSLFRMGPLGMSLFRRGRLSLRPQRIRNIGQLRRILSKARELGGAA